MRDESSEDERYIVIEQRSSDLGALFLGLALGAAAALLLAPRSGVETRAALRRGLGAARARTRAVGEQAARRVTEGFDEMRDALDEGLESARAEVSKRSQQFGEALVAARSAARRARSELRAEVARRERPSPAGAPEEHGSASLGARRSSRQAPPAGARRAPRPD